MASVSAGHIILTPTQPVESGQPQLRGSKPGSPHQELRALPTELPHPRRHQKKELDEPQAWPASPIARLSSPYGDIQRAPKEILDRVKIL